MESLAKEIKATLCYLGGQLSRRPVHCDLICWPSLKVMDLKKPYLKAPHLPVTWEQRKQLRQKLVQYLKRCVPPQEEDYGQLYVPGHRPFHSRAGISISHCPLMGGFVCVLGEGVSVGFDIEVASRVQDKTIKWVSSPQERAKSPNLALLWVAKEASFKSLNIDRVGLKSLNLCLISGWEQCPIAEGKGKGIWRFSFSAPQHKGRGYTFQKAGLALAYTQLD